MRLPLRSIPTPVLAAAAALAIAVAAVVVALASSGSSRPPTGAPGTVAGPRAPTRAEYGGAALPGTTVAPPFTLTDQYGRRVSLGQFRGRVVALTFLYTACGGPCVLIAQQLRGALDELAGEGARMPAVLIVSANPAQDTPARISRFLAEVSLSGRVQYLTGTPAQLRAVWRAYRVRPASAGRGAFAEFASVLLLDGSGRERVLFQSEQLTPEGISHEIARLQRAG